MYWLINFSIDATSDSGRYGRLVNHSHKNPNAEPKVYMVDGTPRLIFQAKKDIDIGCEILYDYGERNSQTIEVNPWLAKWC